MNAFIYIFSNRYFIENIYIFFSFLAFYIYIYIKVYINEGVTENQQELMGAKIE